MSQSWRKDGRVNDLSDDELMALYCDGTPEAFELLFERHRGSVYNFAFTMLRESAGAEDVLQDAFLSVAKSAADYEPRGCFRAWLMRIVRNRCLNRIASSPRESSLIDEMASSKSQEPAESAERNEWMRALRREIGLLPERQREAIVLFAFEEMPYREIADVMEMPINTVKTLIHRARATLAQKVGLPSEERE
jgi:RNA polymerase sigma-70 factor (ECF subfamily)